MQIIHVSAECYPVAKVGGLGDVVGALPKYQNQLGHHSIVVVPAYHNKFLQENDRVQPQRIPQTPAAVLLSCAAAGMASCAVPAVFF